ncbi:MAG: succinate dehydrogenase [Planctomycetes bacterium]|nr:succinate dehydrogenase [Planctomycetota bacterium]
MPESATLPAEKKPGFGATERTDNWWVAPLLSGLGFGAFVVYCILRAVHNKYYHAPSPTYGPLLSPLYSPLIILKGLPAWFSPAFFILWIPAGLRATCYYYRKAYYRSYFAHPTACAVGEPWKGYDGETKFPFVLQNLHRYFIYGGAVILLFLWYDVFKALRWHGSWGVSVGTLVLFANTLFLSFYTFSCHSFRHIFGGCVDCFSKACAGDLRHKVWKGISRLNEHHMFWAWCSLTTVGLADFYVWMVGSHVIRDYRIF